jgi:hypothetical protein
MITVRIGSRVRLLALGLGLLAASAAGQRAERASFQQRDGYEEESFGSQEVTIKTRAGDKKLRISLSTLRVTQTVKMAQIKLPGSGLALVQHAAGEAKIATGKERFEPFEGEWLRLVLPADLGLGTDEDSILLDLILIEETR